MGSKVNRGGWTGSIGGLEASGLQGFAEPEASPNVAVRSPGRGANCVPNVCPDVGDAVASPFGLGLRGRPATRSLRSAASAGATVPNTDERARDTDRCVHSG